MRKTRKTERTKTKISIRSALKYNLWTLIQSYSEMYFHYRKHKWIDLIQHHIIDNSLFNNNNTLNNIFHFQSFNL